MVTAGGEIKLLDFGIAKLMTGGAAHETALTQLAGRALTPDYAAPEQISGAPLTTASDVYALGVVLYELLSGVRPYRLKRGTKAEIEEAILTQEVARPSAAITTQSAAKRSSTGAKLKRQIAGDLDTIVLKALRKAPGERYATAEAFALELDLLQWLAHLNSELDLLEPASALSERSIALARDLHGADSRQLAAALAQKADNLYRAASYVDASKVASEALAIADKEPHST